MLKKHTNAAWWEFPVEHANKQYGTQGIGFPKIRRVASRDRTFPVLDMIQIQKTSREISWREVPRKADNRKLSGTKKTVNDNAAGLPILLSLYLMNMERYGMIGTDLFTIRGEKATPSERIELKKFEDFIYYYYERHREEMKRNAKK